MLLVHLGSGEEREWITLVEGADSFSCWPARAAQADREAVFGLPTRMDACVGRAENVGVGGWGGSFSTSVDV